MRTTMFRPVLAGLAAGLAVTGLTWSAAGTARAASSPGWRVVVRQDYPSSTVSDQSEFGAVVAPAKNDAWAFGSTDEAGSSGKLLAEHWNGRGWSAVSLPSTLTGAISAASASSASNIWVVSLYGGWALHWNGVRWTVPLRLKQNDGYHADFTGVTALSPSNVWVFGGEQNGLTDLVGFGTWHYNGKTWSHLSFNTPGGNVVQASAASASDIWGIGVDFDHNSTPNQISHFNGRVWQDVTIARSGEETPRFDYAASASQVWVDGERTSTPELEPTLDHWNGKSWAPVAVHAPPGVDLLNDITPDGHGGLWIEAQDPDASSSWMLHRSASGAWSSTALPSFATISQTALVPGTGSLWGAGNVPDGGSDAEIWAYGPIIAAASKS